MNDGKEGSCSGRKARSTLDAEELAEDEMMMLLSMDEWAGKDAVMMANVLVVESSVMGRIVLRLSDKCVVRPTGEVSDERVAGTCEPWLGRSFWTTGFMANNWETLFFKVCRFRSSHACFSCCWSQCEEQKK